MKVPGSNVLRKAMRVLGNNTFTWYQFTGTSTNDIGLDVNTFAYGQQVKGSVQPVPRSSLQTLGLDFNKEYINVFSQPPVQDLARDRAGDQIQFNGFRYQVMSDTQWSGIDGWQQSLCVKLQPPNE